MLSLFVFWKKCVVLFLFFLKVIIKCIIRYNLYCFKIIRKYQHVLLLQIVWFNRLNFTQNLWAWPHFFPAGTILLHFVFFLQSFSQFTFYLQPILMNLWYLNWQTTGLQVWSQSNRIIKITMIHTDIHSCRITNEVGKGYL